MATIKRSTVMPVEQITRSIHVLRGHKVLLDAELALLYGVSTTRLNQQYGVISGAFHQISYSN